MRRIEIHNIHICFVDEGSKQKLDEILRIVRDIYRKEVIELVDLTALKEKVTKIETVGDSMKKTMIGIAELLAAQKDDPAAIQAIADELSTKADEWAAAVAANTQQ